MDSTEKRYLVATLEAEAAGESAQPGNKLVLQKKETAPINYDDGITISFAPARPRHLSFACKGSANPAETCDVRLFKKKPSEPIPWASQQRPPPEETIEQPERDQSARDVASSE